VKKMAAEIATTTDPDTKRKVEGQLKDRENQLLGMYHQAALFFADLHDKPARMLEKGAICDIIPWQKSRYLLYWRLRRLLYEDTLKNEISAINSITNDKELLAMICRWFVEHYGQHNQYLFDDNRCVAEWLHTQLDTTTSAVIENIASLKREALRRQMQKLFNDSQTVAFDSLVQLVNSDLSSKQRVDLMAALTACESTSSVKSAASSVTQEVAGEEPALVSDSTQPSDETEIKQ